MWSLVPALLLLACQRMAPAAGTDSTPVVTDTTPTDTAPPVVFSATVEVAENPANPFSALVTLTPNVDAEAWIAWGEGTPDHETPARRVAAGVPTRFVVLGLRADRDFTLVARATTDETTWESPASTFRTAPLPSTWPTCTPTFHVDPASFGPDEVICTNLTGTDGVPFYACMDRDGEPVLAIGTPDGDDITSMRPTPDGGWAATSLNTSKLILFDDAGAVIAEYPPSWFEEHTRFTHSYVDPHELYVIPSGKWAGALAFLTSTSETFEDGSYKIGNGFIVFDPATESVLYDYSFHGHIGDGVPLDIPYERVCSGEDPPDWTHANSLLHHADADGREYFLVSLLAQDWIVKVYPDADELGWKLGFEGDFTLVHDLDAAAPDQRSNLDWMYHQHGLAFTGHEGDRTRLVLFDNGYPRHDATEYRSDLAYSRYIELEYDESLLLADVVFQYGAPHEQVDIPLFSPTCGNVELLPGDAALLGVEGESDHLLEIAYPEGTPRWELTCTSQSWCSYRARFYPDLHTLSWDDR